MVEALLSDRSLQRLAIFAPAALIVAGAWLVWQLIRLLWLLVAGPTLPLTAMPSSLPTPVAAASQAVELSKWHLFGDPGVALDLARLARTAPATTLKLTLRGTFNEEASEVGYAIIADENDVHRRYAVGDRLPGDAELIGIYGGRVLLRRGGVDESLSLPTAALQDADADAAAPAGDAGLQSSESVLASRLPGGSETRPPAPFVNPVMSTGMPSMESIRAATGTDIAELARQVSVFPVLENGRFSGVRLSVGRDSNLLDRAGLLPTDVITAVNGIPLDGPERMAELTAALKDARQITLAVRRDGSTLTIPVGL